MATDDLNAPLGQGTTTKPRRFRIPVAIPQLTAALLGLAVVTFAAWALIADDPLGGSR